MTTAFTGSDVSLPARRARGHEVRGPGFGRWCGRGTYEVSCVECDELHSFDHSDIDEPYVCGGCKRAAERAEAEAESTDRSVDVCLAKAREALGFLHLAARRCGVPSLETFAAESCGCVVTHAAAIWPRLRSVARRYRLLAAAFTGDEGVRAATMFDASRVACRAVVRLARAQRRAAVLLAAKEAA